MFEPTDPGAAASDIDVSVVLPVFNEAGHLADEIDRIRKALDASDYSYEIVVVDDGSTDGSGDRLRRMDGIRLLRLSQNRGSGSARKYGTMAAQGTFVVWTDVDMSYPNDEIPALVDQAEGWDQVVGARRSEQGTVKLLRRPAKWFIRRLASYLTGVRIPDLNSGFRVFRRDVALQFLYLLPRGFSCVTTITLAFLSNAYSVKWVPIDYFARQGESKFRWVADTRRYLMQVVRMVLMYEPLRVFGPPAVAVGLVGLGKLVYDLIDKDFRIATNTIVLLGVAMALALIGMLADLLVQLNKRRHDVMPARLDG
jgi:glycosyltransferase involved in cell wall biosynthesis